MPIPRPMVLEKKDDEAHLTLWGDIYETRPIDWWTDEPVPGDFILLDEVMQALDGLKAKTLHIHLNSYGGDAGVSNTIHNKLRELSRDGTHLTCTVDGVAMSGGSLIMCACDTVRVNPASLIMIHKCWSTVVGAYNADELRDLARTQDAWDAAQIEIYQRKTGLSKTVLDHMMSDTTYMTGREAVEKGFADELLEDAKAPAIAASADRRTLYVNGRAMRIPGIAPDTIPTVSAPPAVSDITPDEPAKGGTPMTLEELRAQYPEMVAEVEAGARASGAAEAAQAERDRLSAIDEVAGLFSADLVRDAKYDHPCTAQELTYRAAVKAAQAGRQFLTDSALDNAQSGVQSVPAAPAPSAAEPMTEAQKQKQARDAIHAMLGGNK